MDRTLHGETRGKNCWRREKNSTRLAEGEFLF
jgi:hypothetical protein